MKRLTPAATALLVAAVISMLPDPVTAGPGGAASRSTRGAQGAPLARLTLRDGTSRLVTLDGVGCVETICSRVAVKTQAVGDVAVYRARFDTISAVRDISDSEALFVFKDGTMRRVSIGPDNRVLYVLNADGRSQKIALRDVSSLEFVLSTQR